MKRELKASVYQINKSKKGFWPMWVAELTERYYDLLLSEPVGKSMTDPNNALYDLRFEIFRRTGEIVDLYV